jgi:hypothetical protein
MRTPTIIDRPPQQSDPNTQRWFDRLTDAINRTNDRNAAAHQEASTATDVEALREDFNALLDRLIRAGVMASEFVTPVSVPAGFGWTPPFRIYDLGDGRFAPAAAFDLRDHAGISAATTYYVDPDGGSNGNTGLSWGQAFRTPTAAINQLGSKTIYVRAGYYYRNQCYTTAWSYDSEMIAVDGRVYFTNDVANEVGAWALVGNHYEATVSGGHTIATVIDDTNVDARDVPQPLTAQASVAAVDATPDSWYQSGATLYVRTHDDRAPDSDVHFYDTTDGNVGPLSIARASGTHYFEGIDFRRKVQFSKAVGVGDLRVYLKDCSGVTFTVNGVTEIIHLRTVASGSATEDCFPYFTQNGVTPKAIEIDCEAYSNGDNGIDQGSTTHTGCHMIRIGGRYHHNNGQNCADVDAALTWMLGCELDHSSGTGFYTAGTAWLDSVHSHHQPNYDLQVPLGATVYTRNCTLEKGANNVAGTLTTY